MNNSFELRDPDNARAMLEDFDPATQAKGENCLRNGLVGSIQCELAGVDYEATVQGVRPFQVGLSYDEVEGWSGTCSCPRVEYCEHVYAVLKSLLAEHNLERVRLLSEGALRNVIPWMPNKPGYARPISASQAQPSTGTFTKEVAAALGRSLRREETDYLKRLERLYATSAQTRQVTWWDLQQNLGFHFGGNQWEPLRLWPAFPADIRTFWLYIAHAAQQQGLVIPEFMVPVTDFGSIEDPLRQWQRRQEIQRWKKLLTNSPIGLPERVLPAPGETDLRLKVLDMKAYLEYKSPGQATFEPLKQRQLQTFLEAARSGRMDMPMEALVLCQFLNAYYQYHYTAELRFSDQAAREVLGRLFRMEPMASRLVTERNQPFERVAEPLHWDFQPAANQQEDYRLRLVQADGTPPENLVLALEGHPPIYISRDKVFMGPPVQAVLLNPTKENRIPAVALESQAGVEFLHRMRIPLPPRLQERVSQIALQVDIHCELRPVPFNQNSENCILQVTATSSDGRVKEIWDGQSWQDSASAPAAKRIPSSQSQIVVYDRSVQMEVPRLLEPLGLKMDYYTRHLGMRVTRKFPELFTAWLQTIPPQVKVHLDGELASLANASVAGQVRLEVSEAEIDWFDLKVVLDVSDTELTPEEIKLLLNARGSYVRLGKKGWRRLEFDLTPEDDAQLARLGLNPHELTAEPQRMHALQLADEAARKFLPEQQVAQIQRRASEIKARVTPELPTGLTVELRPYQREGFNFLAYLTTNRFGGILADDMGLGKTVQALCWLLWLRGEEQKSRDGLRPALVVCPKSVMDNWRAEAERFASNLRVKVWSPGELQQLSNRLAEADLHVINYTQLRSVSDLLAQVRWLAVILDEGQYIKNPSSITAQAARALTAEHRLVLSGTPIENRLLDLWSLMAFAMPGILGNRTHFGKMFGGKNDPLARQRLAARVRPFLLRRTKLQVAKDLPDRVEEDLYCEMEEEQKVLYRAELKFAQQLLLRIKTQKDLQREQFNFLTSLLRLRQICCHPTLVKPGSKAPSAKVSALLEQLEPLMEEEHKVLVFSQFVTMLDLLQPVLEAKGWRIFYLSGQTENRGELVNEFQSAEGAAVFLISLKAGGFGLNLTAADYVMLFDPWWNPAVENQAIDRTHRIGQVNKVMAYRLLIKDSVEEKIRLLQKKKSALAEDVLGEEKFAQSLTVEDLQYLFAE